MARVRLYLTILVMSAGGAAQAELTPPLESRELISTGDVLPGFGRVGEESFFIQGIDDSGQVLFGSHLSDGRVGLFLATGERVSPLWTSSDDSPRLQVGAARISPNGRVLAFASDDETSTPFRSSLYEVASDRLTLLLDEAATTAEGDRVCGLYDMALNEHDEVVLHARATSGAPCDEGPSFQAIYRLDAGLLHRIGERHDFFGSFRLAGVSGDGSVVVDRHTDIVELDGDTEHTLVAAGDPDPSGAPFEYFDEVRLGAAGRIVFVATAAGKRGVYRRDGEGIQRIVATGDTTPTGELIDVIAGAQIDGDGAVVVAVYLRYAPGAPRTAVIRYLADGSGATVLPDAMEPVVNRAGEIALQRLLGDRIEVARWTTADQPLPIVDTETMAPGGGHYLYRGVAPLSFFPTFTSTAVCLDASGRAAILTNTVSEQGLVCMDSAGAHVVARTDHAASDALLALWECEFAADDLIVTAVALRDESPALYRVTGGAPQRLLAAGDRIAGGGTVDYLTGMYSGQDFSGYVAANQRGSLLASAAVDGQPALLLRRAGGRWKRLAGSGNPLPAGFILEAGLTDDDRAVAIIYTDVAGASGEEDTSVVIADDEQAHPVAREDDAQVPGGPYLHFSELRVRGSRAVFLAYGARTRVLVYDANTEALALLPLPADDLSGDVDLLGLTAGGELLYEIDDGPSRRLRKLIDLDGTVQLLAQGGPADPLPIAVGDAGHVLLGTYQSPHGALRQTISLAGPEASAACPGVTTAPTPRSTEDDGCQIGAAPASSPWPLLTLALLLAARRALSRRRAPRASPAP